MRFLRQSMIGVFLAAVSLGLLVYAAYVVQSAVQARLSDDAPAPPPRERVFAVHLERAEARTITPVMETFGEISSRRTLELRAAVAGRVTALHENFEDAGRVTQGEVLVRIDPSEMQAAVDRLSADLADAEAEIRDARRARDLAGAEQTAAEHQVSLREKAYNRQLDLAGRGVGSTAAVETAELQAAAARATVLARRQDVARAEARVDQAATRLLRQRIALTEARRTLADTAIEAPFSGTLSDTSVVEGRLVSANERLADLIDPNDLEVSFQVSTAQYARLLNPEGGLIDTRVLARLDVAGVDAQATGSLSRVSAGAGDGQTGRRVFARLTHASGFRPGDFVTLEIEEQPLPDVISLPASALGSDSTVLVNGEDNRLEVLAVTLLRRQGDQVLVRGEGLEGRDVVTTRTPLLGPGVSIRVLRQEAVVSAGVPDMLELSEERRARLVAFVKGTEHMPAETKERVLAQLAEREVPAQMVARIESRMGG
ncbi:efflux RND transporter periplasmic adaptor subunit [Roseobacter sinensis]|uniref:Efflux RND transporter periplasmic adaptor subunit n=1 Tax=Roseobacter sinensis TaxID=2931391 RepID=A0ABT3BAR1_9RHOB|nr:efflux RND transporter periplasmic adaptor subunit [Roseobacter sp. WL0113]MCV3270666.1 efflux RND transporter periplasmic adaptor subunit [Roseobacter sp. WL0113]